MEKLTEAERRKAQKKAYPSTSDVNAKDQPRSRAKARPANDPKSTQSPLKQAQTSKESAPKVPAGKAPLTVSRKELLNDGSDRDFRRLVQGLLPFLAIHTAIRDRYASLLGMTGSQYTIMLCIRSLNVTGPVSVKVVADHLRFSGSFITAETKSLELEGLIRKERGVEDRRMVSLSLTPAGAALLDKIADLRRQVNDVQFGCLSNDEFKALLPLIERLIPSGEQALALLDYLSTQYRST